MSYTYAQAIDLAEALLDEPGSGNIGSTAQLALMNAANLDVFHELIRVNPSFFMVKASFTWPANTESLDISGASYLNATPYRIYSIEAVEGSSSTITTSNTPRTISPMSWAERIAALGGAMSITEAPSWYTLQGASTLYLAPVPSQAVTLNVYYIPALAKLTSNDSATELLGGKCDEHQVAVAYRYADMIAARQKNKNSAAKQLYAEAKVRMAESASDRNEDQPRYVIVAD